MSVASARQRGVAWVGDHGEAFDLWRVANLAGEGALEPLPLPDGVAQRDDGTFGDASDPAAPPRWEPLLAVVGALEDVGGLHLPLVERACRAVEAAQDDDGGFGATADEDHRILLTGALAGMFARTRCARAGTLNAAADFLAERFSPDRLQGFAWGPIAAYAHTFANLPHEAGDGVLQWVGRELERGFRTGHFDAVRSARVLLWADAPSLPGGRLDAGELVEAIVAEQAGDGGWLRLDDPALAARMAHTLDALTALFRFA